jgi:hypothetical protein
MSIEKLKECKGLIEDAFLFANFRVILNCVVDSTIDLLEREEQKHPGDKDCENPAIKKWTPISNGFYLSSSGECVEFDKDDFCCDGAFAIAMGFICKTEKQAIEKHNQLRAFSRLQSLVMEYGKFDSTKETLYYPHFRDNEWACLRKPVFSPIEIYHTKEVIEDVCRRLNSGEVDL